MDKRARFNLAFEYLRNTGKAHIQKDVAIKMGKDASNISKVFRGNEKFLTDSFLIEFNKTYGCVFNDRWLLTGEGEMLAEKAHINSIVGVNNVMANNSPNAIINSQYGGNTAASCHAVGQNQYGDSPTIERQWRPVMPARLTRMPDFDIMAHIGKQIGGNLERLYSGTAPIDVWHYLEDNDLYPYYQKGDCVGLKAYERGDLRVKTGDVYAIDTKRDGIIVRRCRMSDEGDIVTYTFDEKAPNEYVIPKSDVIRIYKKVLMFRY